MSWLYFQDQWSLNHKCTFDGINRLITVGPNSNSISVKADIYSSWKEWLILYDNAKFLPAVRVSGGDPIGGGSFTGDVYFMINGWRVLIDHSCTVDGVLYSDDYPSPFVQVEGTQIVTNKVASLVTAVSTSGVGSAADVKNAVWGATNLTAYGIGSAGEKLDSVGASANPWNTDLSTYTTTNTAGKILRTAGLDAALAKTQTDTIETTLATLQGTISALPVSVRTEMDANSVKLAQIKAIIDSMSIPTAAQNADAVWTAPVSTMTNKTTIGGWIHKVILSIPFFMGTK